MRYQCTLLLLHAAEYIIGCFSCSTWGVSEAFLSRFRDGFRAYQSGDWPAAKGILLECNAARRSLVGEPLGDGPSTTLLEFMAKHAFTAPENWRGYRELTDK